MKSHCRHKTLLIQQEQNAALGLTETSEEESMTTLHYDTTTRKRINGEWPSLILRMESGKKFRLRPLSLAVEERQNITKLIVTMLKRMAIAGKISASSVAKIASLMTDSVSKNLHIEDKIACTLNPTHIQFHLLCASYICEVFDKGNLSVLCDLESKIELREKLIQHMPMLKSFLSKNECVTVAALQAFSNLQSMTVINYHMKNLISYP